MHRDKLPIDVVVKHVGMDGIGVTLVYPTGNVTHVMPVDIADRLRKGIEEEM
ncbi:MAG: hypothetical protein LBE84_02950 [Planctomycetota bacterium]|jgi:hypothetical protein|nr:hypothetical protein [Planctomycetota bacterium]